MALPESELALPEICLLKFLWAQDQLYMHLTNYSINKRSGNFERSEDVNTGSKRSIKFLNEYLRKNDYDVALMWKKIAVSPRPGGAVQWRRPKGSRTAVLPPFVTEC